LIGGQGLYAVTPRGRFVWGGYYENGLIWHSRWTTTDAVVECHEALAMPSCAGRAVLLRRVVAVRGTARVDVILEPRADYGAVFPRRLHRRDDGVWTADLGGAHMTWSGAADARVRRDRHRGRYLAMGLELPEGRIHDLVLVLDTDAEADQLPDPDDAWNATRSGWTECLPDFSTARAPRDARHAYAVMRGLSSPGGGMVAAATMSLPERARAGRNYDYRYVWIRDQCFAGQSVAAAGPLPLLDEAVRVVSGHMLHDGALLKPAYTVTGDAVPDERTLDLPGYPGGADVVGNWVNQQFQLDAFGESLLLFAAAADHDHLDSDGWRAAQAAMEAIEQHWHEPDAGLWELDSDAWTHSRLICAAGLRRIAAHQPVERAAPWLSLADAIVADTAEHAVHPDGYWQRSPTDARVDAALLLPALRGAIPAQDPRSIGTLRAVERDLVQDDFCYRFRPDEHPLGEAEGAFVMCGFLMSLAYAQQGQKVQATGWFERNRTACGPAGLMAEEYDVRQRQLRGNLPQAFVHALLLECAVTTPAA
jgi:GH15 family glucan-1,4-alpha-glucosidase